jgi:hypothetical protein
MGIRSRRGRGVAEQSYRSTPGLLKYGLAGRAIITIAIATPANRDKTSILLTHFTRADLLRSIEQRATSGRLFFCSPSRTSESLVRSWRDARIC